MSLCVHFVDVRMIRYTCRKAMFKYKMSTVATVSLNSHLLNAIKPPVLFQQRYISNFNRHLIYFVKKVVKNEMNTAWVGFRYTVPILYLIVALKIPVEYCFI